MRKAGNAGNIQTENRPLFQYTGRPTTLIIAEVEKRSVRIGVLNTLITRDLAAKSTNKIREHMAQNSVCHHLGTLGHRA